MSRTRRTVVAVVVVAALALLAVAYLRPGSSAGSGGAGAQVGQMAPLFVSTDLSGQPIVLKDFRGRPVILNFWASWCIPCRTEFPVLAQLRIHHPQVEILGVVFQDNDTSAGAFLQSRGATWPGVRDPKSQIAGAYGVHPKPGIPVSILVDASGRIRTIHYGPLTDQSSADAFVRTAGVT